MRSFSLSSAAVSCWSTDHLLRDSRPGTPAKGRGGERQAILIEGLGIFDPPRPNPGHRQRPGTAYAPSDGRRRACSLGLLNKNIENNPMQSSQLAPALVISANPKD